MPPKTAPVTKEGKAQNKQQKKQSPEPQLDDFFTKFLAKKKRNLNKKLTKIEELEKIPADKLDEPQKECLSSKKDTLEKITKYDEILQQYFEAFKTKDDKDEDAPKQSVPRPKEEAAPKKEEASKAKEEPAAKEHHPSAEELHQRAAKKIAELLTVSSFFNSHPSKEHFEKHHNDKAQQIQKRFGPGYLDNLGNVWKHFNELAEIENHHRLEQIARTLEHYLNKTNQISSYGNQAFLKLHEGIDHLVQDDGFLSSVHFAPVVHVVGIASSHKDHDDSHKKTTEVTEEKHTLVKTSGKEKSGRKDSHKRSRVQSEADNHNIEAHHDSKNDEHHWHDDKPTEHHAKGGEKKEEFFDPDDVRDNDDGWIKVAQGAGKDGHHHRGGDRRGGRGRDHRGGRGGHQRGGRGGPRRERQGEEGENHHEGEQKEGEAKDVQGEQAGAGEQKDGKEEAGQKFENRGERRPPRTAEDGERRGGWRGDGERRGGWRGDGERRGGWRGDGERRGGWRGDGERRGGFRGDGERRGGRGNGERRGYSRNDGQGKPAQTATQEAK